jgi:phosphopantothenoylcysteine decarboxylase/phosphopantothenate--cysteine ligase
MASKKIILGVTGSIAAYKSALLIRLLVKNGHEVQCVATEDALQFIGGITLSTLSKKSLITSLKKDNDWTNHVSNALWADLMLIAPATLNTIGKAANGICDNALLAMYFSAKCPVYWAPAMDLDMYKHPSNQKNIHSLIEIGNQFIFPEEGELASGLYGVGRMAEPENILSLLNL